MNIVFICKCNQSVALTSYPNGDILNKMTASCHYTYKR